MSDDLEDMPNIGRVLADRLRAAGVTSPAQLQRIGDAEAFRKICHDLPEDACTHTRLALAGAVRGVRWHSLDARLRAGLKAAVTVPRSSQAVPPSRPSRRARPDP